VSPHSTIDPSDAVAVFGALEWLSDKLDAMSADHSRRTQGVLLGCDEELDAVMGALAITCHSLHICVDPGVPVVGDKGIAHVRRLLTQCEDAARHLVLAAMDMRREMLH